LFQLLEEKKMRSKKLFTEDFQRKLDTLVNLFGTEIELEKIEYFLQCADGDLHVSANYVMSEIEKQKTKSLPAAGTSLPLRHEAAEEPPLLDPQGEDLQGEDLQGEDSQLSAMEKHPLQSVLAEISEELRCPLCLNFFKDPVDLGCSHVFCLECLESLETDSSIQCPLCRKFTALTAGVHSLPRNLYLANIVEKLKNSQLAQMCGKCSNCVSTLYCKQCKMGLCLPCSNDLHKGKQLAKHERISYEDSFALNPAHTKAGYLIPFELKKSKCLELARNWVHRLWFAPPDLASALVLNINSFKAIFVPFWLFEVDATFTYNSYPVEPTATLNGKIEGSYTDLMICASDSPISALSRAVGPWDIGLMQKATLKHITDSTDILPFTTGEETAWQKAVLRLQQIGKEVCQQKANLTLDLKVSVSTRNKKAHHLFIPIYQASYTYRGTEYQIVINGSTGKVHGERPYGSGRLGLGAPKMVSAMSFLLSKLRLDM